MVVSRHLFEVSTQFLMEPSRILCNNSLLCSESSISISYHRTDNLFSNKSKKKGTFRYDANNKTQFKPTFSDMHQLPQCDPEHCSCEFRSYFERVQDNWGTSFWDDFPLSLKPRSQVADCSVYFWSQVARLSSMAKALDAFILLEIAVEKRKARAGKPPSQHAGRCRPRDIAAVIKELKRPLEDNPVRGYLSDNDHDVRSDRASETVAHGTGAHREPGETEDKVGINDDKENKENIPPAAVEDAHHTAATVASTFEAAADAAVGHTEKQAGNPSTGVDVLYEDLARYNDELLGLGCEIEAVKYELRQARAELERCRRKRRSMKRERDWIEGLIKTLGSEQ